jgi:predicted nucleic acid-binding protein
VIAADTSSLIAYFAGDSGGDTGLIQTALANGQICLPPVVLTELLSDAKSRSRLEPVVALWPLLEIRDGYWVRAAQARGALLARGLKPKIPDTLIAQSCIDHDVELITRDGDFRHFATHCGLKLA